MSRSQLRTAAQSLIAVVLEFMETNNFMQPWMKLMHVMQSFHLTESPVRSNSSTRAKNTLFFPSGRPALLYLVGISFSPVGFWYMEIFEAWGLKRGIHDVVVESLLEGGSSYPQKAQPFLQGSLSVILYYCRVHC